MLVTRKINKDAVAVVTNGYYEVLLGISLRKSGKAYYGTEEGAVYFCEDKIVINKPVAEKYGLKVIVRGE